MVDLPQPSLKYALLLIARQQPNEPRHFYEQLVNGKNNMNPNKQRISIAEACGWVFMDGGNFSGIDYKSVKPPHGLTCTMSHSAAILSTPDYLNDLNAMHEAEKAKEMAFDSDYAYWLAHVAVRDRGLNEDKLDVGDGYQIALTSTAAQRAEAFLRTIGKWEE